MTAAIESAFERCRPWLVSALRIDCEASPDELLDDLLTGRAQLWEAERGAVVTQCMVTPQGPAIHAWLGAGRLSDLLGLRPGIEAYGRTHGAQWATVEGRRGWSRIYRPFGYELDADGVLRKHL